MAGRFAAAKVGKSASAEVCDRCGVRARTLVDLDNGGHLYLCSGHIAEHERVLRRIARLRDLPT